jgi:hypothetical protein
MMKRRVNRLWTPIAFRSSRSYFAKPPLFDTVICWNDISKCHEDDFFDAPVV